MKLADIEAYDREVTEVVRLFSRERLLARRKIRPGVNFVTPNILGVWRLLHGHYAGKSVEVSHGEMFDSLVIGLTFSKRNSELSKAVFSAAECKEYLGL